MAAVKKRSVKSKKGRREGGRQNREARFSFSALGNCLDPVIIVELFGITIFQWKHNNTLTPLDFYDNLYLATCRHFFRNGG